MASAAMLIDNEAELGDASADKSWIGALSDRFWADKSSSNQTEQNDDSKGNEDENDNLMDWFRDIVSGSESSKSKKDIMSEVRQQLAENNMYSRLFSSTLRNAANIFAKLSHRVDLSYPPKSELNALDMTEGINQSLMLDIRYCVRHALASYKKIKLAYHTKESKIALHSTKSLLRDYFDIPQEDIVIDNSHRNMKQFCDKLHAPRYYLILDHKYERIVLSIRGSASKLDRITDLNGNAKAFNAHDTDGYVHEGILASANHIFHEVTAELIKQCNKYKEYELIITGHSLGAGVAAVLGLMYKDHPVLCKQNQLRIFAFASPPIASKSFADIEMNYILSVTLTTDFISRLSIESVKKHNLRVDLVHETEEKVIEQCMKKLDDDDDDVEEEEEEQKEDAGTKPAAFAFLSKLKKIESPNPDHLLYPLGRVLWFVPNAVMEDDVVVRRKCLMCLDDDAQEKKKDEVENEDTNEKKETGAVDEAVSTKKKTHAKKPSLGEKWSAFSLRMREKCQAGKNAERAETMSKYLKQYGPHNYVLCETKCVDIFQEMVVEVPESMYAHLPGRYLWACGTGIIDRPDI